jgi:hypothetical protein
MRLLELVGETGGLGWVAVKAVLMFAVAVVGLRLGERRTLAQLGAFDFAVAVAASGLPLPPCAGKPDPQWTPRSDLMTAIERLKGHVAQKVGRETVSYDSGRYGPASAVSDVSLPYCRRPTRGGMG